MPEVPLPGSELASQSPILVEEGYAHEVASAFSSLTDSIGTACEIVDQPLYLLDESELEELRQCLRVIAIEVENQMYEALNVLAEVGSPIDRVGMVGPRPRGSKPRTE